MKIQREQLQKELHELNIESKNSDLSPDALLLNRPGNLTSTKLFADGFFTLQDESSMLVVQYLDPKPGMLVLDCCAAPGGKSTHISETMNNTGSVVAVDLHPHKRRLIEEQALRLGLTNIQTVTDDACNLDQRFSHKTFDRILLDAPCSGLGVLRRKPDLKWHKKPADLQSLVQLQKKLLAAVAPLLKSNGVLVYSTCTLNKQENEEVVADFLEHHEDFTMLRGCPSGLNSAIMSKMEIGPGMIQVFPDAYESDGFFIARFRRK